MKATKNKLILKKADYDLLVKYIYSRMSPMSNENKNAEQLYEELRSAEIHENENDIPGDVVRINSLVEVQEQTTGRRLKFRLVTPGDANLRKGRLSVFAPLGIAIKELVQNNFRFIEIIIEIIKPVIIPNVCKKPIDKLRLVSDITP